MTKGLMLLMAIMLVSFLAVSCGGSNAGDMVEYTVTFDLNGGTITGILEEQSVMKGNKAKKPSAVPRVAGEDEHYEFDCWTKEGETTAFDFSKGITSDTNLVAKWKNKYYVGGRGPAGGYIFYINPDYDADSSDNNWMYLEASDEDMPYSGYSGGVVGYNFYFGYYWGNGDTTPQLTVCTSENSDGNGENAQIGKGKTNTTILVNTMDLMPGRDANDYKRIVYSPGVYAAYLCRYNYGSDTEFIDWFIPSLEELNLMYENLKKKGIGTFNGEVYWSSSEKNANTTWVQNFTDGKKTDIERGEKKYVRPCRSF